VITSGNLQNQTKAELSVIAKRLGVQVAGMSKEQLVAAIGRSTKNGRVSATKKSKKVIQPAKKSAANKPAKAAKVKAKPVVKSRKAAANPQSGSGKVVPENYKAAANKSGKPAVASNQAKSAKLVAAKPASTKAAESAKPTTTQKPPATSKPGPTGKPSKPTAAKPVASVINKVKAAATPAASAKPVVNKAPDQKPAAKAEKPKPAPVSHTSPKVLKKIREMQLQREASKDIGFRPRLVKPPGATDPVFEKEPQKDRIALFVRDPFWLHASWDITRGAVERAQAALAEQWYGARPVLRLIRIDDSGATSVSETVQCEIEIRGGVRNWYIPWTGESASFRVSVGYLGVHGRFHVIALSNIVRTPASSSPDAVDQHWSDLGPEGERIYAMSGGYDTERETGELQEMLEERLNRSLGAPTLARLGAAADAIYQRRSGFHFDMDVELVVYGSTSADAYLTLNEEPVNLRPDGTFVVRLPFPDRRQVIPAVAVARDGSHQRTIVVGVERNTKIMEPMEQEQDLGE
jgi:uncharacterized protein